MLEALEAFNSQLTGIPGVSRSLSNARFAALAWLKGLAVFIELHSN
jgi:hypothetical protein